MTRIVTPYVGRSIPGKELKVNDTLVRGDDACLVSRFEEPGNGGRVAVLDEYGPATRVFVQDETPVVVLVPNPLLAQHMTEMALFVKKLMGL